MNGEFVIAVHALVYLYHKQTSLASEVLAENVCTNPARIRKVMASLKKAGLVKTREGVKGGYELAVSGEAITLAQIDEALETDMVKVGWHSGDPNRSCLIASGMADYMDALAADMNQLCEAYLREITIQEIEAQLCHKLSAGCSSHRMA